MIPITGQTIIAVAALIYNRVHIESWQTENHEQFRKD